jgi:hypothetical protein
VARHGGTEIPPATIIIDAQSKIHIQTEQMHQSTKHEIETGHQI